MSRTFLLDVNVLVALTWAGHVHHSAAHAWMHAEPRRRWASCPFTECGLIRILSNAKKTPGGGHLPDAFVSLQKARDFPGHSFWPDDYSPADEPLFGQLQGHNQITDAYLLCLAKRRKGVLATFDAGIQTLARDLLGDEKRVLLIPAD